MPVNGKLPSLPAATREGYTFDGWYDSNGVKITADYVFTDSVTITAKWIKDDSEDKDNFINLLILAIVAAETVVIVSLTFLCSRKK